MTKFSAQLEVVVYSLRSLRKVERAWNDRLIYRNTCLDSKNPQNAKNSMWLHLSRCGNHHINISVLRWGTDTQIHPSTESWNFQLNWQVTEEEDLNHTWPGIWLQLLRSTDCKGLLTVVWDVVGRYSSTLWKFWAFHKPSHSIIGNYLTESFELEGTHGEHQVHLFSEWPMQGSNLQPWC